MNPELTAKLLADVREEVLVLLFSRYVCRTHQEIVRLNPRLQDDQHFDFCKWAQHVYAQANASSYTPGEPADHPPLQAADIYAYSLGHMIEHKPPKKTEAETAFNFFVDLTFDSQKLGHKFFTRFDRNAMLMRLGEAPES